jgi:hypothetical protein
MPSKINDTEEGCPRVDMKKRRCRSSVSELLRLPTTDKEPGSCLFFCKFLFKNICVDRLSIVESLYHSALKPYKRSNFFENAINRVQYKSRRILPTNSSVYGIPGEMAPTLTPPIPRVHPTHKTSTKPWHPQPFANPHFDGPNHCNLLLDLTLSHVESALIRLLHILQSVGWGVGQLSISSSPLIYY